MDAVLRAFAIYAVLLVLFRISGRRTLSQMTTFDFVLLLIIGEATQQALLGEDFSLTNAFLVIMTLLAIDIGLSLVKQRSKTAEKLIDGVPMIIVENGRLLHDRMRKSRIDEADVLEAARRLQGLERLDQIKFAVVEVSGGITVIPKERI
ncbi:DUF421 domain-containing protein [Rhodospirillaceae bacterium SYSU D60014]|uniref:DUF421 domain-containing protein n=1 Tax=Virgifigura deserti TaxID=2268457 RepID=UPI000E65FD47